MSTTGNTTCLIRRLNVSVVSPFRNGARPAYTRSRLRLINASPPHTHTVIFVQRARRNTFVSFLSSAFLIQTTRPIGTIPPRRRFVSSFSNRHGETASGQDGEHSGKTVSYRKPERRTVDDLVSTRVGNVMIFCCRTLPRLRNNIRQ